MSSRRTARAPSGSCRIWSIRVVALTGDNERTAQAISAEAGVDGVIAGVLPDGKEGCNPYTLKGRADAMVGDGINDAPALTRADVGIAIRAGTADIAIDAADVVLMRKSRLSDVPAVIPPEPGDPAQYPREPVLGIIYNIIGIPLAAGIWYPIFTGEAGIDVWRGGDEPLEFLPSSRMHCG